MRRRQRQTYHHCQHGCATMYQYLTSRHPSSLQEHPIDGRATPLSIAPTRTTMCVNRGSKRC